MPLDLKSRGVGRVTVIECTGRITAGPESEALRAHVHHLLRDRKHLVLHLGDVAFVDSSGLGTIVRLLTSTRQSHGDLKLCNVPPFIQQTLKMTNLHRLFDAHDSEENAIAAFYQRAAAAAEAPCTGPSVLCVDQSNDVLAYLRELLKCGGYDVHTTTRIQDALVLLRVTRPAFILLGPNVSAAPATSQAFRHAAATLPVIELGHEFSTLQAGEAAAQLLEQLNARMAKPPSA